MRDPKFPKKAPKKPELAQEEAVKHPARIRQILKQCGSLKNAMLIHEIFKRPYE
jgi:hypothetical protein